MRTLIVTGVVSPRDFGAPFIKGEYRWRRAAVGRRLRFAGLVLANSFRVVEGDRSYSYTFGPSRLSRGKSRCAQLPLELMNLQVNGRLFGALPLCFRV
jgi:hypothetical protein